MSSYAKILKTLCEGFLLSLGILLGLRVLLGLGVLVNFVGFLISFYKFNSFDKVVKSFVKFRNLVKFRSFIGAILFQPPITFQPSKRYFSPPSLNN